MTSELERLEALIRERYEAADPSNFPETGGLPWNSGYRFALAGVLDTIRSIRVQEEPEWEYAWMGDELSQNQYWSYAEALEYLGNPRQFRRRKAGPWEEVK